MKDHSTTPPHQIASLDEQNERMAARSAQRKRLFGRWRPTRLAFWLSLPAILVWLAPTIIGRTSLHVSLVRSAVGSFDGQISTGGASLGWLSPVRLYDVVITDKEGREVLVVSRIESERTLLGLATHTSDPGLFRVHEPRVLVQLRQDGSNLEDLLASLPKKEKESSSARPALALEVIDGSLLLVDETVDAAWRAERVLARVDLPANAAAPLDVKLEMRVHSDDRPADLAMTRTGRRAVAEHDLDRVDPNRVGTVTAEFLWRPGADGDAPLGHGQVQLHAETLPLEFLGGGLRRFVEPQMKLAGSVSVSGSYAWSSSSSADPADATHQVTLDSFDLHRLDWTSPRWLRRDRLRVDQVAGHGRLRLADRRIELQDIDLDAGFARVQASGSAQVDDLRELAPGGQRAAPAGDDSYELRGQIDLAQLSQLLPDTLRIREGTRITSGTLTATLSSRHENGGQRWEGKVESTNLTAENLGRRVTWEQPIRMQLAAQQTSSGLIIERLDCVSNFLTAEARGTLDDGQISLRGDLQQLSEELGRFVDLESSQMAGQLRGDVAWRRQANDQIEARGDLRLEQLRLVLGDTRPWQENLLEASLTARATAEGTTIGRIESADLHVAAGADALDVQLTEAVAGPLSSASWPVRGRLVGRLEQWLPRVQLWLPLAGWSLAGTTDATFAGRLSTREMVCDEGRLLVNNLQARGPGWNVVEPQVKVEFTADWNREANRFQLPALVLTSSAVALRADKVAVETGSGGTQLAATVAFRSDLGRLTGWMHDAGRPPDWFLAGMSVGQIKLAVNDAASVAQWSVDVDNLAYSVGVPVTASATTGPSRVAAASATGTALKPLWNEPKLQIAGQGKYEGASGVLHIERCAATGSDLQVIAKGQVSDLAGQCIVDLDGELGYDLAELSTRLRPLLGPAVDLRGRDSQPFVLRGPVRLPTLTKSSDGTEGEAPADKRFAAARPQGPTLHWPPADLSGEAGIRWDSIHAYGLPIGPGEIHGRLAQGTIDFKPLDLEVSEGRLKAAAHLMFEPRGPVLVADPGQFLDNVRISPEMCAQWLKFVLPIAADAAQVDGRLSLGIEDAAHVPLSDPLDGEMRGTLDVRSVQVGPGPLSRELISLAQLVQAIVRKQPLPTDLSGNQQRLWVELPGQRIPYHWKERRVYHDNLQLAVKDVVIITRGSVGIDNTLDLMAEVPVRDEWVASNRYLQSLQGQKIQVPITGTLTAPRVDRRVLQQIASQSVTGAVNGLLEQEVTRGIDKLFKPRGTQPPPPPKP